MADTSNIPPTTVAPRAPNADARWRWKVVLVSWGPLVAICAGIFWLSSKPALGEPNILLTALVVLFGDTAWFARFRGQFETLDAVSSWLGHFVEYAMLTMAALWAMRRQWPHFAHAHLVALGFAAAYAVSDELHQAFVPGRHADWRDVATDLLGASFAILLVWAVSRTHRSGSNRVGDNSAPSR